MAYDPALANRVRDYLRQIPGLAVDEKKMFGGVAFLVDGKMCINVTGNQLMCRFDPADLGEVSKRRGWEPMIMRGKALAGYCRVNPEGFNDPVDFAYWTELCLGFNDKARASKKRK